MASSVTMKTIYDELKVLKKDIETVKYALIPEEKISAKELKEVRKIKREMQAGNEKSFKDVFIE